MENPKPDKRLAKIIKEYPSLDEKTKDMIDAIDSVKNLSQNLLLPLNS